MSKILHQAKTHSLELHLAEVPLSYIEDRILTDPEELFIRQLMGKMGRIKMQRVKIVMQTAKTVPKMCIKIRIQMQMDKQTTKEFYHLKHWRREIQAPILLSIQVTFSVQVTTTFLKQT